MDAPNRADGLFAGCSELQLAPSQTQVSLTKPLGPAPPKRRSWPVPRSYAIDGKSRAAGLVAGDWALQFGVAACGPQTQVSPREPPVLAPAKPPNSTSWPVPGSKAMGLTSRTDGLVAG